MFELFYMGGTLFMGILTLILIAVLIVSVINGLAVNSGKISFEDGIRRLAYIKSIGLLGLVFGVFGQLRGLYDAFSAIEQVKTISPAMLAGGLKVSMITTLYGLVIYLISLLIWLALSIILKKRT